MTRPRQDPISKTKWPSSIYLFFKHGQLPNKFIEDIKLQLHGDLSRFNEARTLALRLSQHGQEEPGNVFCEEPAETEENYDGYWGAPGHTGHTMRTSPTSPGMMIMPMMDGGLMMMPTMNTSSTAQGGGGSFKNRKPIGEVGCCESGMAERSH